MAPEKREFIDPNELMRYINEVHSYAGLPVAAHVCTMELLTYAPRVDAVEVVRCKDCKHCTVTAGGMLCECALPTKPVHDYYIHRSSILAIVKPNDFCSHGERRET